MRITGLFLLIALALWPMHPVGAQTPWVIEIVESAGRVGNWSSLALDAQGNSHLSYVDCIPGNLLYARKSEGVWTIETVDGSANWVGQFSSLDLDAQGNPHIAYYDNTADHVLYACKIGEESWTIETVDGSGNAHGLIGMAVDAQGNPHISYGDIANNTLLYAWKSGSVWTIETVDGSLGPGGENGISLVLDSQGDPHIAYDDRSVHNLLYARKLGGVWTTETVDGSGGISSSYASLALDAQGNPHISYRDDTVHHVLYAHKSGGVWTIETVDDAGSLYLGGALSLALDPLGKPHIGYSETSLDLLLYARKSGGNWMIETVDGSDGNVSSLAIDALGNPHIGYFDNTLRYLKYAYVEPENIVCDPDTSYLTAAAPIQSVDVDYLGGGSGLVYAYSIRFSWDPAVVGCSPANVSEGDLLSDQGNTWFEVHESGGNEITVDCVLLGAQPGVSGPGTMFTAEFTGLAVGVSDLDVTVLKVRDKDNMELTGFLERDGLLVTDVQTPSVSNVLIENLTLAHTNDFIKDGDAARVTATVTDDDPLFTRTDITADLFVFGEGSSVNPDSYTGNVATWTLPLPSVVCNPQDGLLEVTVTATDPIGNSASDVGDITADNTDPGPITGFDASPHHERVSLSWDNPGGLDTHFYGVLVRYDAGGDYPEYIALGSYPVDQNDGDGEAFNQTGAVTGGDHPVIPRDIHYYTAFAYDMALNYGAAAGSGQDRATNYWLGDVAAYDGTVDFGDISDLSGTYWLDEGESGWNAECDVGPTDNASALGIPLPDDEVGFEDLIIFAMNFSVVSPTGKIPQVQIAGGEDTGALRLRLIPESTDEDPGSFRVVLDGNRDQVKAARIEIRHDPGCAAFLGLSPSPALMSAGRVFLQGAERSPGHVIIDLAVLGNGEVLHGSGDLATLRFRIDDPVAAVKLDHVDLRGAGNTKLLAAMENAAGAGGEVAPNVTRLTGAEPNPFNPATTILYTLHRPEQVRVRIFDAEGRLVRGLVDGPQNAGHHRAVWDGRNDRGRALGSGIYFVQMTAGDYSSTSKVVLLR